MEELSVNGVPYRVLRLLGKGKGGYSYLTEREGKQYVVKQIHHEPCAYYQFGDKLASELNDYARLQAVGIPMPTLLDADPANERVLKEYIEGDTVFDMVRDGQDVTPYLAQVQKMCDALYPAGLNIDYFPTNFVVRQGIAYYIDYECNSYMDQWNFENWGIKYWSQTEEFLQYLREHQKA